MVIILDVSNLALQQAIHDLEKVEAIPAIDRAHILLVAHGNKPSMHTAFFSEEVKYGEKVSHSYTECITYFSELLTLLSLKYLLETEVIARTSNGVTTYVTKTLFCIAKQYDTAEQLLDARKKNDEVLEGRLLGFPESAIDAFVRDDTIPLSAWPTHSQFITESEMKFLNHAVSFDNWENETKYLHEYASVTRRLSPAIYEAVVAQ